VVAARARGTRGAAGGGAMRRAAAIGRLGGLVAPVVALLAVLLPAPGARAAGPYDGAFYAEMHSTYNGKCVNVAENSTDAGVKIQQYHCDNTPADKFYFTAAGPVGYYEIRGQNSHLCITPDPSQSLHDGTPLVQWPCTGAATQLWGLYYAIDGRYTIVNDAIALCITDPGWSWDDWIQLQIQTCHGGDATQIWYLLTS
jgi:Ricin-type beta-trefoil lectin domain